WSTADCRAAITELVDQPDAADMLVSAAELGIATRDTLAALGRGEQRFDLDAGYAQLDLAGVVTTLRGPLPAEEAIATVRDCISERGLESHGYPVSELVAGRVEVGWMVHVPPPAGEIMVGRALFYVADDGVLERSSSSTPVSAYEPGFTDRFRQRLAQ